MGVEVGGEARAPAVWSSVGFPVETGRPGRDRREFVDHERAAGDEEAGGVRGAVALGLASAVQHEEVVRAALLDALPVAVADLDVGAVPEEVRGDAGAFRVPFDTDQAGARWGAGRQPGQADATARTGLGDAVGCTGGQQLEEAALLGPAGVGETVRACRVDGPLDQRGSAGNALPSRCRCRSR